MECSAAARIPKHGGSYTRLYAIWSDMKNRCNCESAPSRRWYGARGITVCDEWQRSFEAFRNWAVANGYAETLELDRQRVNEGYSQSNCRWVTRHQQMANTRKRCDGLTSRFKGVCRLPSGTWRAQIVRGGTNTHVGCYPTALAAALAYDAVAYELRGRYAMLNFPERFNRKEVTHFSFISQKE